MAENPLEIPQALRDMSEQNLKQARAAYEQFMDFVTKTIGAWMGALPSNPMAAVVKDAQGRAMQIAKENAESAFTFAGKISNTRTPQEIVTLQTQFAQDRMFWCFSLFIARPSKPTLSNVRSFPKRRRTGFRQFNASLPAAQPTTRTARCYPSLTSSPNTPIR